MRLKRFLQLAGVASRRKADQWIQQGRVRVNDRVVQEPWFQVDPERDVITVDGRVVQIPDSAGQLYFKFYKPRGVVSTMEDRHAERTIQEFIPPDAKGVHPVGRLDRDSEGLMILTNDGQVTYVLTHPRFGVPKTYVVTYEGGLPQEEMVRRLHEGFMLHDGPFRPTAVEIVGERTIRLTLTEGRKREIRRAFRKLGAEVTRLVRVQIGPISLDPDLSPGELRPLSPSEIQALRAFVQRARSSPSSEGGLSKIR